MDQVVDRGSDINLDFYALIPKDFLYSTGLLNSNETLKKTTRIVKYDLISGVLLLKDNMKKSDKLLLLCLLSYSFLYLGRKNYSICMSLIINDNLLTTFQAGIVGTVFLICYALGQIINGIIGDHVPPQNLIKIGILGSGIMNILMTFALKPISFTILWGLNGIFCSMCWAPTIRFIGLTQETKEIASLKAFQMVFTLPIGMLLSYFINGLILTKYSWRNAFFVSGILIFILGIFDIFFLKYKFPQKQNKPIKDNKTKSNTINYNIKFLTLLQTGLVGAIMGIFFNGSIKDGLDLWLQTLLSEYFQVSASTTSLLSSMLPIISIGGIFLLRFQVKKYFENEMKTCAILYLIATISFFIFMLIAYFYNQDYKIIFISLAIIFIAISMSAILAINNFILTVIPMNYLIFNKTSTITGLFNAIAYFSASISGIFIGYLANKSNWFNVIVYFFIICLLGLIFTTLFINNNSRGKIKLKKLINEN